LHDGGIPQNLLSRRYLPMTVNFQNVRQRRVGGVARFSGVSMIILGGLSAVFTVMHPLSAEFAVSMAIFALGWAEWRLGGRLRDGRSEVIPLLIWNQLGVATVVTLYSLWRIYVTTDEAVWTVLDRPEISASLDLLEPMIGLNWSGACRV